jgi:hypothetical protein
MLAVLNVPPPQTFVAGEEISFQLPASTFVAPAGAVKVGIGVVQGDGAPLPGWLGFDAATGTFHGTPPAGFVGDLAIKVIATDEQGHRVETAFTLHVGMNGASLDMSKPIYACGRPSLTEQFARHGHARHLALLDHASRLRVGRS